MYIVIGSDGHWGKHHFPKSAWHLAGDPPKYKGWIASTEATVENGKIVNSAYKPVRFI